MIGVVGLCFLLTRFHFSTMAAFLLLIFFVAFSEVMLYDDKFLLLVVKIERDDVSQGKHYPKWMDQTREEMAVG